MRLWRLARSPYMDCDGKGAYYFGGRWNSPGKAVVYTSADPALAILEARIHLDLAPEFIPDDYLLLTIDTARIMLETAPFIKKASARRKFGDCWLSEARTPLLCVKSILVPQSNNVLINPIHPQAATIKIVARRQFNLSLNFLSS